MTEKNRRRFTAAFKAKVAMDALREQHTTAGGHRTPPRRQCHSARLQ